MTPHVLECYHLTTVGKISESSPFLSQGDLPETAWSGSSPCTVVVEQTLLGGTTERAGEQEWEPSAQLVDEIEVDTDSPPWVRAKKGLCPHLTR